MPTLNSFGTRTDIRVGGEAVEIYSLPALETAGFAGVSRLPYSLKILLENLLRREDDAYVKGDDIRALADWNATAKVEKVTRSSGGSGNWSRQANGPADSDPWATSAASGGPSEPPF